MKYLALTIVLASLSAQAHIEPEIYAGVSEAGQVCTMTAGETTFQDGLHHPLTERFALEVEGVAFSAGHPSAVDVQNAAVTFNHDLVQGINATSQGAKALVVTMVHTAQFEGPSEYTFIEDNWVTKTKTVKHCGQLTYKGPAK